VTLHAFWDTTSGLGAGAFGQFIGAAVLSLLVTLVGMTLLIQRVREAQRLGAVVSVPEVQGDEGWTHRPGGDADSYLVGNVLARPIGQDDEDCTGSNMPRIGREAMLTERAYLTDDHRGALQDPKAELVGQMSWHDPEAKEATANAVDRGKDPDWKSNVVKDTSSHSKRSKPQRVSHRKELAVVTLAMVASISGVGGLLAANQPTSSQPTQTTGAPNRPAIATAARRGGAGRRPVRLVPSAWRSDDGRESDDGGGGAIQRPAKVHRVRKAVPAFSAHSRQAPSAVSQGS
jgi:hypothetical protein